MHLFTLLSKLIFSAPPFSDELVLVDSLERLSIQDDIKHAQETAKTLNKDTYILSYILDCEDPAAIKLVPPYAQESIKQHDRDVKFRFNASCDSLRRSSPIYKKVSLFVVLLRELQLNGLEEEEQEEEDDSAAKASTGRGKEEQEEEDDTEDNASTGRGKEEQDEEDEDQWRIRLRKLLSRREYKQKLFDFDINYIYNVLDRWYG